MLQRPAFFFFFFFNDTATTEIYTLSLHDALPIWGPNVYGLEILLRRVGSARRINCLEQRACVPRRRYFRRSEEHTSELQSPCNLVCRLLLEKKKKHNQL